jgi:hypothetical protein
MRAATSLRQDFRHACLTHTDDDALIVVFDWNPI